MKIMINGNPLGDPIDHFVRHFKPTDILQEILNAPFGSGGDFFIMSGLVLTVATIGWLFIPKDKPKAKTLFNIIAYVILGVVALTIFQSQAWTLWAVVSRW